MMRALEAFLAVALGLPCGACSSSPRGNPPAVASGSSSGSSGSAGGGTSAGNTGGASGARGSGSTSGNATGSSGSTSGNATGLSGSTSSAGAASGSPIADAGPSDGGPDARAKRTYSTDFPLSENPISEGGNWIGGALGGANLWGNIETMPGMAFGVSEPTQYGDPTAILTGAWSANQMAQATVRIVNTAVSTGGCCHEAEVRLRKTINAPAHTITGYEAYCSVMSSNPYCHIASWGGPNGVWVNMDANSPSLYLKDGDVLKATATGINPVVITMYINGTQILQVQDTGAYTFTDGKKYGPWPSGAPGFGFYDNSDNHWSYFGFSSFSAAEL